MIYQTEKDYIKIKDKLPEEIVYLGDKIDSIYDKGGTYEDYLPFKLSLEDELKKSVRANDLSCELAQIVGDYFALHIEFSNIDPFSI